MAPLADRATQGFGAKGAPRTEQVRNEHKLLHLLIMQSFLGRSITYPIYR